jgi:hypothetical protein
VQSYYAQAAKLLFDGTAGHQPNRGAWAKVRISTEEPLPHAVAYKINARDK